MTQIASSSSRLTSNETAPESGETADQIPIPPISSNAVNDNVVPKPDAAIKQEVIDLTVPGSPGSREVIELTDSEDENQQAESGLSGKVKKEVPEITLPTNLGVIELFDSDEEDQGQQPAILKVNAKGKHMENPGVPSIDPVNPIQLNPNTEQLSMSGSATAIPTDETGDLGAPKTNVGQVRIFDLYSESDESELGRSLHRQQ